MGVVIRRWVWLEAIGVVSGCFPHITLYPYCSCICSFLQQHPYFFFHFVKMIFRSLHIYISHSTTHKGKLYHTLVLKK